MIARRLEIWRYSFTVVLRFLPLKLSHGATVGPLSVHIHAGHADLYRRLLRRWIYSESFVVTTPCTTACQITKSLLRLNEACFTVFQRPQLFTTFFAMSFRLSGHKSIEQVIYGERLSYQCRLITFLTGLIVTSRKGAHDSK